MERQVQGTLIGLAGLSLTVIQVFHAWTRTMTTVGLAVDAIPFVLMSLTVAYVGYWVARDEDHSDENLQWVGIWAIGGVVGFASISALILFSANVAARGFPVFESAPALAMDNITAGALAGILVGLYDARSRERLTDLEQERERVEAFAERAADVNNYGRAVNECTSLEEVSALCIEALERFVDLGGAAFVEQHGDETTIVDSTIIGIDDESAALAGLLERTTDLEPAVAETYTDDIPAALGDDVTAVMGLLVTRVDGTTVSIIALNRSDTEIEEETRTLLEMLVSHASTAIRNMYRDRDAGPQPGTATPGDED